MAGNLEIPPLKARRMARFKSILHRVQPVGSIALFFMLWELAARLQWINPRFVPPPSQVFASLVAMLENGMLLEDTVASVQRSLAGFFLGSLVAILLGLLTGHAAWCRRLFEPIIQLFRPIPSIAFVPLATLWFGLGETPKVFLIAYGAFFPVWLNTHVGVGTVDRDYLRAARCLGANARQIFFGIVLPAALPFIVAGLRFGIGVAFIVLVAAEMTGASAGLGYRIEQSHLVFRPDQMLVGLLMLGVLGAVADWVFHKITSKTLLFWVN